jgi:DNA primase
MAGSDNNVELIKERLSLAEIVGESVSLKQSGSRMTGLCPFHREKTPSFFVSDDTGSFNCFGCGKSGDIFTFVMETKGMSFVEALRYLAGRAGVELKPRTNSDAAKEAEQREQKSKLREIAYLVQQVYQRELASSEMAKNYLSRRGITEETVNLFKVGFAPNRWDYLAEAVFPLLSTSTKLSNMNELELQKHLLTLGLVTVGKGSPSEDSESIFDFLRNRVIFPISRSDGLPVAFGGRTLASDDKAPKYLNTKETPLYQKRKTLYALAQSLQGLRRSHEALLVEGYFDLISLFQVGFDNVLGSCGTAFTSDHAKLISRFASRVKILFDGDSAGRKAAASCFEIFLNTGVDCAVIQLPDGEDPDTLARKHSRDELDQLLVQWSVSLPKFYLQWLKGAEGVDLGPAGLGALAKKYTQIVKRAENPVEREALIRIGADELGISQESLLRSAGMTQRPRAQPTAPLQERPPPRMVERTPQAPARPRPKVRERTDSFIAIWRQAIVASLCEPSFAANFVETAIQLSQEGSKFDLTSKQLQIVEKVRQLVSELAAAEINGIFAIIEEHGEDEVNFRAGIDKLARLITRHGLMDRNNTLLREAMLQAGVGAAELSKVVEESNVAAVRLLERRTLNRIRRLENDSVEEADKLVLAQRKLEERRKSGDFAPK